MGSRKRGARGLRQPEQFGCLATGLASESREHRTTQDRERDEPESNHGIAFLDAQRRRVDSALTRRVPAALTATLRTRRRTPAETLFLRQSSWRVAETSNLCAAGVSCLVSAAGAAAHFEAIRSIVRPTLGRLINENASLKSDTPRLRWAQSGASKRFESVSVDDARGVEAPAVSPWT